MKRQNEESLGDVLRRTIEENGMTARLDETRAASLWPGIVGPAIAAASSRPMRSEERRVGKECGS